MLLKPQDILVLLKLVAVGNIDWSFNKLAIELSMSPSEVHAASNRALASNLAIQKNKKILPNIGNLEEFLIHGLKYVFVAERGEMVRGMPTGYAAPPLKSKFAADSEPLPVWPDAEGNVRGMAFSPLYKSAPKAARVDEQLYKLLVLVDAIRGGRAREVNFAIKELKKRLEAYD
ncbi:MAG: hypothetical protein ACI909_001224 [Planctomycetota bacterium]|jgi:hypothetical protein